MSKDKLGEIYTAEIGFLDKRHCLNCPLRDKEDDSCNLQKVDGYNLGLETWENQMAIKIQLIF